MSNLSTAVSSAFQIDGLGFAAFIRLVEARVARDIATAQAELHSEHRKLLQLQAESNRLLQGLWQGIQASKVSALEQLIRDKQIWIQTWSSNAWAQISQLPGTDITTLQAMTWEEVAEQFSPTQTRWLQRYLILQEAILAPLYHGIDGYSNDLSEADIYDNCETIARLWGFAPGVGRAILVDTDDFVKCVTGYWSRIAQWTIGGTVATLLTAGLAAPVMATLLGGLMGLSGAAATSAGLAFFGGGAIAAGGLGMAGGFAVIVGGGGLLGAATAGGIAHLSHTLPKEVFVISAAKIINYLNFLNNNRPTNHLAAIAEQYQQQVIDDFLHLKSSLEGDLAHGTIPSSDLEAGMNSYHILQIAFEKIVALSNASPSASSDTE